MNEAKRRREAAKAAEAAGVNGLLVTHPADVRYLTGFTGSSAALAIAGGRAALFTDGRYKTQAKAETGGLRVVVGEKAAAILAVEWLAETGVMRCGFDSAQTSVAALERLRKVVPGLKRRSFFVAVEG